jgi:hypothetical protein
MAAVPITTRGHAGVGQGSAASALRTPPPALHRHVDRRGDGGDHRRGSGLAGAGGVEVDHVDPRAPARRTRAWATGSSP